MKKKSILLAVCVLFNFGVVAVAKAPKLTVSPALTVKYQCDGNRSLTASYYSLSNKSLDFVLLEWNKKTFTLPQIVSASGSRYSDLHQIQWWIKGSDATLDEDVNDDASILISCREAKKKR